MSLKQTPIVFAVFSASVAAFSTTTLAQEDQGALIEYAPAMGRSSWVDPDCGNPAFGTPIRAHWLAGGINGREGLCPPPEQVCSSIGRSIGMGFNGVTSMPHWLR